MKCPSCSEALSALAERCPACGAVVAPAVEGALAPNPRTATPPPNSPREKVEPLRDIPGMPKKERTWRDEVQDRVRKRRKKRTQSSLPLFEQPAVTGEPPAPTEATPSPPVHPEPAPRSPITAPFPTAGGERPVVRDADFEATPLTEEELADLPLRTATSTAGDAEPRARPGTPPVRVELPSDTPPLDEQLIAPEDEAAVSLSPSPNEPAPLERPARVGERAQAAMVDAGILVVLGALVVYFAGRAARVDVPSLAVSWPWLLFYLAFLGLFYAGYFTGTTGQTPGKMIAGLRVVDARGRPPGYLRASLRAMAGAAGTVLGGLGLIPMALDPARRALHDRLLRTRVVHR
ncbi:MAG: RDD family protein [Acidobacteriota bacterium]|jgi:uncharacterized RDD family membrane protein YckC